MQINNKLIAREDELTGYFILSVEKRFLCKWHPYYYIFIFTYEQCLFVE